MAAPGARQGSPWTGAYLPRCAQPSADARRMAQSLVEAARRVDLLVSALPPEPTSTNNEVDCETAGRVKGGRDGGG